VLIFSRILVELPEIHNSIAITMPITYCDNAKKDWLILE